MRLPVEIYSRTIWPIEKHALLLGFLHICCNFLAKFRTIAEGLQVGHQTSKYFLPILFNNLPANSHLAPLPPISSSWSQKGIP